MCPELPDHLEELEIAESAEWGITKKVGRPNMAVQQAHVHGGAPIATCPAL